MASAPYNHTAGKREQILQNHSHSRHINFISTVLIIIISIISIQQYLFGFKFIAVALASSTTLTLANLFLLYKTKNITLCAHILLLLTFITIVTITSILGGFFDPVFSWLFLIPIFSAILLNRSHTGLYTFATLIVATILFTLTVTGEIPFISLAKEQSFLFSYLNHLLPLTILGIVAYHFLFEQERYEDALKRSREKVRQSAKFYKKVASHDQLTGLANRYIFENALQHALLIARRNEQNLAVLILDLDRFKNVNDTYGHKVGDKLLQETALRLQSCLRDTDTVARLGGDEFIIIMEGIENDKYPAQIAKRIIREFNKPFHIDKHELYTSISSGIAIYPYDGTSSDELLRNSDIALYKAKEMGRNCYQYYKKDLHNKIKQQLDLERRLHHAIANNELVLYYQPLFDMKTKKITSVEALLRWVTPDMGTVLPDDFIPIARQSILILKIGEWVINTAFYQLQQWLKTHKEFSQTLEISINISTNQLIQPDFIAIVETALKKHEVPAKQIIFEISEAELLRDAELITHVLAKLDSLGIQLIIDHFGYGYESIKHLESLKIKAVKIGKNFAADISTSQRQALIYEGMTKIPHGIGCRVVALGIETKEQLDYANQCGCEEVQGFYFSKPLTSSKISLLLSNNKLCHRNINIGGSF